MFVLTMEDSQNLAFPDVCNTPSPSGTTPISYPNISETTMTEPTTAVDFVLIEFMPALNLSSEIVLSDGDEPGSLGGVVSGTIMGETKFTLGSEIYFLDNMPAVRFSATTLQNKENAVGENITPSETLVLVLS